ncbi:hypothetical protein AXG93_4492s1350 [Marchantia polymorpha subsp. ruderalis]|uniref:Terpene synthase metal-binding domain-containing protein n=1 Tax=Marchantia polymorpha subsp. ruderalis TaxID=1480154 RepID=A0A176W5E1_MARPO|nr:hypothetical protein AXG93_4492s1350 [Marchantia polymorpha subsp. ruderalis]
MAISTAAWSAPIWMTSTTPNAGQVPRNFSSGLRPSLTLGARLSDLLLSRSTCRNKTLGDNVGAVHTTNDSASRVPKWRNYAHRIHSSATEVKELETTDNKLSANSSTARPNDTHMQAWIEEIRGLLRSMFEKGETSDSPYDTAWVSLIPAVDGSQGPQFPNTLKWIARNQLEDGSWGDVDFFSIQNNVLCTLMCIIALKSWNTGLDSVEKGLRFLRKSMALLEDETHEKLVGFELVFPSILDHAKNLDLDLPYNLPVIDKLRAAREEKLRKIPLHLIYTTPTSVTYSLEGIRDVVDWEQISQQQQQTDGSFGCSPAATACAYLHTGNESCFRYLTSIPQLCDGAGTSAAESDVRGPVHATSLTLTTRPWPFAYFVCMVMISSLRIGIEWIISLQDVVYVHVLEVADVEMTWQVGSALSNPWYEHLPRLEHRSYLDQYGPQHVWISKVLYRMHSFTNSVFLKLAKADFNLCQSKHQEELQVLLRWNEERGFNSIRTREKQMVYCFYVAVCILPAPEQSMARTVWAKLAMLNVLIDDFFDSPSESYTDKVQFLEAFRSRNPNLMDGTGGEAKLFFESIYNTITEIAAEGSLFQGRDISHHVYNIWLRLVENQFKEAEWKHLNYEPSLEEYMSVSEVGISFEAMTPTQFFMGEKISPAMVDSPHTKRLMHLANVVARLSNDIRTYQREESENKPNWVSISKRNGLTESEIIEEARKVMDEHMKQLVKETYSPSKSHPLLPRSARQLYFDTVRAIRFAYRTGDALAPHMLDTKQSIDSILFEPVLL